MATNGGFQGIARELIGEAGDGMTLVTLVTLVLGVSLSSLGGGNVPAVTVVSKLTAVFRMSLES